MKLDLRSFLLWIGRPSGVNDTFAAMQWHDWFCWYPRMVDGHLICWRTIETKLFRRDGSRFYWTYRLKEK